MLFFFCLQPERAANISIFFVFVSTAPEFIMGLLWCQNDRNRRQECPDCEQVQTSGMGIVIVTFDSIENRKHNCEGVDTKTESRHELGIVQDGHDSSGEGKDGDSKAVNGVTAIAVGRDAPDTGSADEADHNPNNCRERVFGLVELVWVSKDRDQCRDVHQQKPSLEFLQCLQISQLTQSIGETDDPQSLEEPNREQSSREHSSSCIFSSEKGEQRDERTDGDEEVGASASIEIMRAIASNNRANDRTNEAKYKESNIGDGN